MVPFPGVRLRGGNTTGGGLSIVSWSDFDRSTLLARLKKLKKTRLCRICHKSSDRPRRWSRLLGVCLCAMVAVAV